MRLYNLHTHHFTAVSDIIELVNQYPDTFDRSVPVWSIGIHPWRIEQSRIEDDFKFLEEKLSSKGCYAVGECGLDKRIDTPLQQQAIVFERQLALAEHYKKPVIIHCVAAFQEIIEVKKRLGITVPMIIHGFSKNIQLAESLIKNGFYISFGKYLLLNPDLETVFKAIPEDKIFLETDTIDDDILKVYEVAAKYRGVSIEEIGGVVERNFRRVFKKVF